jgi:quercetin dioxygenase-like cupin family protein
MKTFDRPKRVEKPWGHELWWAQTERYVGKLLHVKAGHQLSLQYHERKDETIHLWSGEMKLALDERNGAGLAEHVMKAGDSYHVRPGVVHRMIALTDCDVLEVSTPEVEDVVRLEDAYGRAPRGG